MLFTNGTCRECKTGASELAKLAELCHDFPKVARVECTHDFEVCDMFVNHLQSSNETFPYMVYATTDKGYIYPHRINADEIYQNFISMGKYKTFPVHGGPGYSTAKMFEEGRDYISKKMIAETLQEEADRPYFIDEMFAKVFGEYIGYIFYQLGFDHWRPLSKVIIFCGFFFMPIVIGLFEACKGGPKKVEPKCQTCPNGGCKNC